MNKILCGFINIICNGDEAISPIYNAITLIGPYAMGVVSLLGVIYGIIMGTKYAKAEDSQQRAALQKGLVNGIIGFLTVLFLIILLYALKAPIADFMDS